jgi:putative peptidoglycan lipid II flippase
MARLSFLRTHNAFRSSALTGLAQVVLALAAAGAGALLAQKFGRTAETDGFLAAYGVYLLLVLAAQALRLVVVPDLTRAAASGRLGGETWAFARAFLVLAVPASALVIVFSARLGDLITGSLPPTAAHTAGRALVVVVPAAFAQLLAALAASALAARDSYGTAAAGFAIGGIVGLVVFAAFSSHGVIALGWGLGANATCALLVPVVALIRKGVFARAERVRHDELARLWKLVEGTAVPLAIQGCYLLALRFAAKLGVGSVTSFSYAYLAASTLVAATAFPLGVVSSAPLTRRGLDSEQAGRHVVHASWVSLAIVGAAAGVFALVGGQIVQFVLGDAYRGDVGRQIGHLVAYLSVWMVAWVGFVVTFPLVFVAGRRRWLVPLAVLGVASCIPLGLGFRSEWALAGIALAVGVATLVVAFGLMAAISRQTFAVGASGLVRLALAIGAASALSFGGLGLVLSPWAAAAAGTLVYAAVIYSIRSYGLSEAVAYVRGLH